MSSGRGGSPDEQRCETCAYGGPAIGFLWCSAIGKATHPLAGQDCDKYEAAREDEFVMPRYWQDQLDGLTSRPADE